MQQPFIKPARGLDWFTPAELKHLPWEVRNRIQTQAREAVYRNRPYRWIFGMAVFLYLVHTVGQFFGLDRLFHHFMFNLDSAINFVACAVILGWLVLERRLMRRERRRLLLEAGLRPGRCFDCGYYLEGYDGDECYVCGCRLVSETKPAIPS